MICASNFSTVQGYVVRIAGGNDKQGFPMKQGVLSNGRVKLLLKKGHSCFRPRRKGDRRRRSVRGCIVDSNLSVLNLVIIKKGEKDIPGRREGRREGEGEGRREREECTGFIKAVLSLILVG